MKYKIFGLLAAALICTAAFFASYAANDRPTRRIHQHREARGPHEECSCDGSTLCTHLPLIIIETGGKEIPGKPIHDEFGAEDIFTVTDEGEEMLTVHVSVIDNADANNHPGDAPAVESSALFRVRGNSSRYFDKSSYLLRFVDDKGEYANYKVMGMDAHYEWAMHGPYLDKSLIRNYMWYNIGGEIMEYAPNVRFCEVIVDGEYRGLYVMTETLTSGENCRLKLSEPLENTNRTGYLVRIDRGSTVDIKNIDTFLHHAYRNFQPMDIKFPRSGKLTPEIVDGIKRELSDFEKSMYSYDYDTDDYGYWRYIDTDSFVDYFILTEFTANYDAGWLSTYLYKNIGGKYKLAIWDYNSACENYSHSVISPHHLELQYNIWYYMLFKDEYFTEKVLRRYRELRRGVLSDEYLCNYIDEVVAYLGDAVDRNFAVWGASFDKHMLYPEERNPKSHEQAVGQMKDFIRERGAWLDEHLEIIRQYSHESKVKKFNH